MKNTVSLSELLYYLAMMNHLLHYCWTVYCGWLNLKPTLMMLFVMY